MENKKEIEAPLKYNYDTPENREMLKTKISDMFSQSSLFETYEHKTQFFWNLVEEIKETMYIIVKNIEHIKSDLSKSNEKINEKDKDNNLHNHNHNDVIQLHTSENVIKGQINISKIEKINLLDKIKMQHTHRDQKDKTAPKILPEKLRSKNNSNYNTINKPVEISVKKTQIKEKEIIPKKEIDLLKGDRLKSRSKDVKNLKTSAKENKNKVDKKENIKISNLNYNTNTTTSSINPKSTSLNAKSSLETKRLSLPLTKEKIKKISTVLPEKKNQKLQSIEINLNCDQEPIKIESIATEEMIRENLQKNENKDLTLALENLNISSGHPLDSQENQITELKIDDYKTQKDIEPVDTDMVETSF